MWRKLSAIHWVLMCILASFTLIYRRQSMDVHYGWPFEYGMDQWDVANDSFPTLAGFRLFAFLGNLIIAGAVGLVIGELTHRAARRFQL